MMQKHERGRPARESAIQYGGDFLAKNPHIAEYEDKKQGFCLRRTIPQNDNQDLTNEAAKPC